MVEFEKVARASRLERNRPGCSSDWLDTASEDACAPVPMSLQTIHKKSLEEKQ